MPMAQGNGAIKVIMHDPMDFETIEKLRFVLNREIEVALAPQEAIVEAINKLLRSVDHRDRVGRLDAPGIHRHARSTSPTTGRRAASRRRRTRWRKGTRPVIRLVHLIIQEAVTMRASDIHIEPFADRVRIRYRIDGVLHGTRHRPPAAARADRQPAQDHGLDRHRREAAAPGRPDQDPRRRQGYRPACQHPPDHPWPVGRHADPRPREHQGRPPGPGLRATTTSHGSSN